MQLIEALSLDLDDTLWPIEPVLARAEQALDDWLAAHCPDVAVAFPIAQMRELRARVYAAHPELAHDFTTLRKISLRQVFAGTGRDEDWVERAFEVFFAARNQVTLYEDALPALHALARRWPIASLSNGNADLDRIGVAQHFSARVHARTVGAAKPHARIFEAAAQALGVCCARIAHVGDDPELDVMGAKRAGMFAVWLNRNDAPWPLPGVQPDLTITRLDQLAPALDARAGGSARKEHAA